MGIELRHLRYVIAVAEERSFRRAAERLHLSQPPLSRQVQDVEQRLGVALFVRGRTGVETTTAGVAFVTEARQVLAQVDKTLDAARNAHAASRAGAAAPVLSVGFTTVFDRSAFPDIEAGLASQRHAPRLVVQRKHSVQLVRDVERGVLDAAFIARHTDVRSLQATSLDEQPLLVALPASHALCRRRRLALEDLRDVPLFWFERRLNPGYHDHCRAVFERAGYAPPLLREPADHHVLLGLIADGRGIALVPPSLRAVRRQGVAWRALRADAGLTTGVLLVHRPGDRSAVLQRLLALLSLITAG